MEAIPHLHVESAWLLLCHISKVKKESEGPEGPTTFQVRLEGMMHGRLIALEPG